MPYGEFIVVPGTQITHTPTIARVAASTSPVTIAAETGHRLTLKLVNDSQYIAYIKYGTGADDEDFSWVLDPGERWEMPTIVANGNTRPEYYGIITAVWVSAQGAMQVTQIES